MKFSTAEYSQKLIAALEEHPSWRYGQAQFNVLNDNWPELADEIRATDTDPFYAESNDDQRIARFWRYLFDMDPSIKKHVIFVYGTLKKGHSNHKHYLLNAEFVGKAETVGNHYRMRSLGGFPLVETVDEPRLGTYIKGEVYRVSDDELAVIDQLEGHPEWYERTDVKVLINGHVSDIAQMYLMPAGKYPGAPEVMSGEW